jgi:tritrans,polycis-undecaprenyl-diphosphate synthase [geranylgeranyl-diphosphate specific]
MDGEEAKLLAQIKKRKIPQHIAIIMDGNRRYAIENNLDIWEGHKKGGSALEVIAEGTFRDLGIKYLTVYALSTKNLKRPKEEVDKLLGLFEKNFSRLINDERIHKHEIKLTFIGDISILPPKLRELFKIAEETTSKYNNYFLNFAVCYDGRKEILASVKSIAKKVKAGYLSVDSITEDVFEKHLWSGVLPRPELIIRPGGEIRLSGFLLWGASYAELYFCNTLWPNFRKIDLFKAIYNFQTRERRFGR